MGYKHVGQSVWFKSQTEVFFSDAAESNNFGLPINLIDHAPTAYSTLCWQQT